MSDKKKKVKGRVKNQNAVALGKLGGKVGGPARAKKLGRLKREQIAKMGGEARKKQRQQGDNKKGKKSS